MLLRHIRYLKAVADHGSFTRAAQALHVSQPALSQQITELEERLGAQLLDRRGRQIQPTDLGRAYLERARRALDELGNLCGCDVHTTTILGSVDEGIFRNLGILVTSEPVYQRKSLYKKK